MRPLLPLPSVGAMRRGVVLLAVLCIGPVAGLAAEPTVILKAPRSHGWWIGDVLPIEAVLEIDEGESLDPASLPRPRAVTYWLDLRDVAVRDDGIIGNRHRYRLVFDYQTFYAPLEPKALIIPPVTLRLAALGNGSEITIPPFTFVTAPIREIMAPTEIEALAPLRPLSVIDTRPAQLASLSGLAIALAAGTGLCWHWGWGPFRQRAARPFTAALRRIKVDLVPGEDNARLKAAHLSLHRAFDAAMGRRMIAGDVERFLAAHPDFMEAEGEIRPFFAASDRLFFGLNDPLSKTMTRGRLLALAQHLAAIERRRP